MSAVTFAATPPFLAWNMPDWTPSTANSSAPEASPDEENVRLMLLVKQGDVQAFEQLVELHQRAVIGTVARMLNNVDDAHDVAQQVFVRVWRSAPRYEPSAKFTTWLFTIMRNLVFNEMRRRSRKREVSMDEQQEDSHREHADSPRHHPDTTVAQSELEEAIDRAIQTLPEKQRLAVTLRRDLDMPYEEICEILGMSLSAVKSLLFRARNDLKERLKGYLDEE
ncbi:RNA polymerase sigma factor [Roseimicrobium gellanilyticum]|nr:sigma-70 family RNA polymerase sigma factor [Roseimicrobium gellanilyticum]